MGQKGEIITLLSAKGALTQGELAEAIYGDKFHSTNIHSALMSLVNSNMVARSDTYPAKYSLYRTSATEQTIDNIKTVPAKPAHTVAHHHNIQQQTSVMTAEIAVHLILDYFNETVKDNHGRYLSWRHCYKAFSENRNVSNEQVIDYLALHLAFYLASWGMYRGSSFLLQKDYKVHIPVVKIIQEPQYNPLFGISAEELCKECNLILLDDIGVRIRNCYAKEKPSLHGVVNNATDTLVTKILLGTLGCVPAYDRYYVQSIKKHHISGGIYNRSSVYRVARFYCDNLCEFETLRHELSKCGVEYPPMKLMDMCFWQDAYIEDLKQR